MKTHLVAGAIERFGGERASNTVYQNFKVDNSSVGSEYIKGCCLYCRAFQIPFDPNNTLDGVFGIQLSEAIPYIVAYRVNISLGKEENDSNATTTDFTADSFLLMQANTIVFSFSSGNDAEEEWTTRGIASIITILISYLRMFSYVCITLGGNPCLSSSYNSILLNAWTDWEVYYNLVEEFQVPQKVSFHFIEFMLLWRFTTRMFVLVLSFSLRLRGQAKTCKFTWQVMMAFQLIHLVLSIKSHNYQSFNRLITGVSYHIFSSNHKACHGFEIIGWELASITILDSNLEDKVLIEDGSIVINRHQPNLIQVAIGLKRTIGSSTSNSARLIWDPG
nr:uncharacterized protein LOC117274377 [Nicotiana tomentosiformis]